jgi:hypothetical protein
VRHVTTVNDEIHLSAKHRLERALEPGEEVRQTQMRVCEEEEAEVAASHTCTSAAMSPEEIE